MELTSLIKIFDFSNYGVYDWVAQILGFIGLAFFVASALQKRRLSIIICQFIALSFLFANMAMMHAVAGMIMNGLGAVRMIIYYFRGKQRWASHWAWVLGFSLNFICVGIYPGIIRDGWIALLPTIACVAATIGYSFESAIKIRIMVLIACPLWLIYDLYFLNYASALNDTISTVSALIGFLAIDVPILIKTYKTKRKQAL